MNTKKTFALSGQYLHLLLLFILILHFIYDGIILSSIRQNNRNKLFALRGELRWLMIEGNEKDIPHTNHPIYY